MALHAPGQEAVHLIRPSRSATTPISPTQSEAARFLNWAPSSVSITFVPLGLVGLWQFVCWLELVPRILLPTPLDTLADMYSMAINLLSGGYVLQAVMITASEMFLGFCIAATVGFFLGILVGETLFGKRAVMPYLVAIDTMPKIAFAPLFVAWLGFGIASKVALAAFMATFPVIVGMAAGFGAVDENGRMLFKSIGASRLQTVRRLSLPLAMPYFFAGLKIAAVSVTAGAIAGEFLGGGQGFGQLIRVAAGQLNTARVFSLILYLSLIGLFFYSVVGWIERRVVYWR